MTTPTPDDEQVKAQVSKEMEDAKTLAKTFNFEQVKSGEWFIKLLQQVVRAYDRNARATYFQKKYPGLTPDEIADILVSVTVKYATIAGAIAGVAASANEIAAISSAGLTVSLITLVLMMGWYFFFVCIVKISSGFQMIFPHFISQRIFRSTFCILLVPISQIIFW